MKKKLTDLVVAQRAPAAGRIEIWDTLLPGFGLRISSTGARTWMVAQRRPGVKHPVRLKIGNLPDLSLADARAKARSTMAGEAPPVPVMFLGLAEQFLAHGRTKRGRLLRLATTKEYRRALIGYATPLHAKPVRDIRRGEVADLIRTVATERGATSAMRARAALSRFWSWMLASDLVDANVVTGTEGYATPKRDRVLSDAELRAIWSYTEQRTDFCMIVRLCLWLGVRRGEAGGMADSELANGLWTVPGSRTKNHRPLVLPLPRQALAALEAWPRFVGKDRLFGRGRNGFQGWSAAKKRMDVWLGFNRDWDLHDGRRTVETRMAGLGIDKHIVNRVLNHAAGPITETYDLYDYLPEKRDALQRWADELDGIATNP
jgi:integrase